MNAPRIGIKPLPFCTGKLIFPKRTAHFFLSLFPAAAQQHQRIKTLITAAIPAITTPMQDFLPLKDTHKKL
jgi:hypothetical protein